MTQESQTEPFVPRKWLLCNGQQLRKLVHASLYWLEQNHQHVNALNVFPVPDGDTGTNMLLTMRSAYGRIQDSEELHVGKVADKLAHGALMGARGNSGVILSQIWRGLAKGMHGKEQFDAVGLARALNDAADTAYSGVMRPVEGTILTVIRAGAKEAIDAAEKSSDLRFMLERVLERCQQSLEKTPDLLPVLKQAGVVDSGGQGLVYILEGMLRYVHGKMDEIKNGNLTATAAVVSTAPAQAFAVPESGQIENPYDVQFILTGQNLNVDEVRSRIDAMGDSTVVVGDETTIKVHIHVQDPGQPISYGISLGQITDVVVENMQMQMEEIVGDTAPNPVLPAVEVQPGQIGIVAVAAGQGLADIFRSLGAAFIVNGGQTNNPSTEEIFQAIQDVPTDRVVILPNNKNIILAAEAARELSPKHVTVIPTRTVPQGLSAMLTYDPDGDLDEISAAMTEASQYVATGEITRATRTVTLDGVEVHEGEIIGLINGRLSTSGPDLDQVLSALLAAMEMDEREIVSLYYGQDVSAAEATAVAQKIEAGYPDVEVELLSGGQAHYFYILGAE
ncbi:MAG: DAK2 domain-containing protein [Anaerolineales bacterium]|nr:DAK2 domain-containing protein [Anaerolineales bacterium]MCA9929327.1 DAK2 domain-containing protein [Anaerolineales bacterium]